MGEDDTSQKRRIQVDPTEIPPRITPPDGDSKPQTTGTPTPFQDGDFHQEAPVPVTYPSQNPRGI